MWMIAGGKPGEPEKPEAPQEIPKEFPDKHGDDPDSRPPERA